jgi:hypothetical protein
MVWIPCIKEIIMMMMMIIIIIIILKYTKKLQKELKEK